MGSWKKAINLLYFILGYNINDNREVSVFNPREYWKEGE